MLRLHCKLDVGWRMVPSVPKFHDRKGLSSAWSALASCGREFRDERFPDMFISIEIDVCRTQA
jgi:hypothetical protein